MPLTGSAGIACLDFGYYCGNTKLRIFLFLSVKERINEYILT